MKRLLIIALLACVWLPVFSQIKPISNANKDSLALKPIAQLIQKYGQLKIPFSPVSFLSESPENEQLKNYHDILLSATTARINLDSVRKFVQKKSPAISFSFPFNGKEIKVDLVKVNIMTEDFSIITSESNIVPYTPGVYYRGVIHGDNNSLAAFSFFDNEIFGIVSNNRDGNIVIGKLKANQNANNYIIYSDRNLKNLPGFKCSTFDSPPTPSNLKQARTDNTLTTNCVSMYYETDFDIFQNSGNDVTNTANWMTAVHNNVSTIYANDTINVALRQIFIWTSPDPYTGTSAQTQLNLFRQTRASFNGDIGQLVGIDNGGVSGLAAAINGLCNNTTKYAYSAVEYSFNNVPLFSRTIHTVTHEFGHLLGSQHTHACAWGVNHNTQIDDCGNVWAANNSQPIEGNTCYNPNSPILPLVSQGTIMSYCNPPLSTVGINFANGFGPQPRARIRDSINNASCLNTSCLSNDNITMNGSGTFIACSGNFYDGGGPTGDYALNQNTVVTLYPSTPGAKLSVNFTSFQTDANKDFLYVYNGNSTSATQIGTLTGPSGYGTITSTAPDGSLTFKFISDSYHVFNSEAGWTATISCSPAPPVNITMLASGSDTICGGNFYDGGGLTGDYMPVQNTVVTLYPSTPGAKLSVNFTSFQTAENMDFLYVYNGNSIAAPQIGRLTGQSGYGRITSTADDGSLTFKFTSDDYHVFNNEAGWTATISCTSIPPDSITMLASGSVTTCGGKFYDGGGPTGDYMIDQNTVMTLHPSTAGTKLKMTFASFKSSLGLDFLYVYNGNNTSAPLIRTLTGNISADTITSTASNGSLTFKFISNNFHSCCGAEAGWAAAISCTPVISICQNGAGVLTSPLSETTYQWQVNTGSGFANISNNSNYSGVTTASLQLTNIQSSFYGYEYRCKVDNVYSTSLILKITATWTGAAGVAWENPANWSCGFMPDGNTDVIINSPVLHYPEVNSNVSCRSLTVQSEASVLVKPTFKINITGQ